MLQKGVLSWVANKETIAMFISRFICCYALIFCVSSAVHAQATSKDITNQITQQNSDAFRFGALSERLLSDDPRLSNQKVALIDIHISLREAMKQWSAQTGIAFEARDDNKDVSGRWQVAMALRDAVTAADAMDALRSVMSEQGATWQWERSGSSPNYTYRFLSPATLTKHQEQLRQQVQKEYEESFAVSKRGLEMSPEELKREAENDPTGMLKRLRDYPLVREGLNVMAANFTPSQQDLVLQGQTPKIYLSMGDLDASGKTYAMDQGRRFRVDPEASLSRVGIEYRHDKGQFLPAFVLYTRRTDGSGSGQPYAGGMEMEHNWRSTMAQASILTGDKADAPETDEQIIKGPVTPPGHTKPLTDFLKDHYQQDALSKLAEATSPRINFIACLAQSFRNGYEMPVYGENVRSFLEEFSQQNVASKWRHNVLLLRFTAGFSSGDRGELLPSDEFTAFVHNHINNWKEQKAVPIRDIIQMTTMGSAPQWASLFYEEGAPFPFLEDLSKSYPLFTVMEKQGPEVTQALLSSNGARLGELTSAFRRALEIPSGTPSAARILCQDDSNPRTGNQEQTKIRWVLKGEGGNPDTLLKEAIYKAVTN